MSSTSDAPSTGESMYSLGVDVGTGSVRAGVFAIDNGRRVGLATCPIATWRPAPDYVEQSSDDIWHAAGVCVRAAVTESGVDPAEIAGIGFDATCSLVALGENDAPITESPTGVDAQNVIVWMDHRALEETEAINAGGYDVLKFVGGRISPEMEPPKMLWLKTHLPESWSRIRKLFDLADYLTYRASGRDVRSLCTSVCKWLYVGGEARWDKSFYAAIGLDDVLAPGGPVGTAPVRPLGERIGPLTPAAAEHLGLTTRCQVAVGAIDAHAGGLGLLGSTLSGDEPLGKTTSQTGILESVVALIGGTSNCHMAASRNANFVPGVWGPYFGAMVPEMWLTEGGQSAAGSLIDFVIESHPAYAGALLEAENRGQTIYAYLNAVAKALAVHRSLADIGLLTRDLHVLDYHLGNRSPHADPYALGVIDGVTLNRGVEALAPLYVATLQAVAYGTRAIIEAMNASGFRITAIVATGGGTKNPLWLRMHADATGLPVLLGSESESVLLGAAILGATASGGHPDVLSAMRAMSRSGGRIMPNPAMRHYNDAKYDVYKALYAEQTAHRERMRAS